MNVGQKILQFFKYFDEPAEKDSERSKQDELKLILAEGKLVQDLEEDESNDDAV
jgi:hypothetical protein